MLLTDLPPDARPREKLLARGASALADSELLALLLRTGLPGKNVLQLAQELLDQFGGITGLLNTPPDSLKTIKGLDYLQLRIGSLPYESFVVVFLDARQRLIACDEMFKGTLSRASVYPREVVMRALQHSAHSVVLAHNHPSGDVQPSQADKALTHSLRAALALIDISVLDHVIVGAGKSLSMLETGTF
jgi:DNA repair protein RadC